MARRWRNKQDIGAKAEAAPSTDFAPAELEPRIKVMPPTGPFGMVLRAGDDPTEYLARMRQAMRDAREVEEARARRSVRSPHRRSLRRL